MQPLAHICIRCVPCEAQVICLHVVVLHPAADLQYPRFCYSTVQPAADLQYLHSVTKQCSLYLTCSACSPVTKRDAAYCTDRFTTHHGVCMMLSSPFLLDLYGEQHAADWSWPFMFVKPLRSP